MSDVTPDHSNPITLALMAGVSALLGALGGAAATVYARGRADGQRDQQIDSYATRILVLETRLSKAEERQSIGEQNHAVLTARVEANIEMTREVRDIARRLESGKRA